MVHSTPGLFLTCTQESNLYLHNIQLFTDHTMYMQFYWTPTYLEGQSLAHGGKFPSAPVPCLVATAPPFSFCPFHPFPTLSAHITLFTKTTSTITVFFVQDSSGDSSELKGGNFKQQQMLLLFVKLIEAWNLVYWLHAWLGQQLTGIVFKRCKTVQYKRVAE